MFIRSLILGAALRSIPFFEEDGGGGGGGGTPPALFTPEGSFAEKWTDNLPADFVPAEDRDAFLTHASKYKNALDVVKSDFHKERMLGKRVEGIKPLSDKSTPEEIAAFRKLLGAPEKPDGYPLKPEALPQGVEWNEETMKGFAEIASRHHAPVALMKDLVEHFAKNEGARAESITAAARQAAEADEKALRGEWGGDYEKNIDLATRAAKFLGVDSKHVSFSYPGNVKGFAKLGELMSEHGLITGDGPAAGSKRGADEGKDIQTNPDNPLYKKYQEGDAETVEHVRKLLRHG